MKTTMWPKSRMRLTALVSGAVLSFAACSIAGHLIPEKLENFTRFHIFLSPDSLYYPTVRSVFNTALTIVKHDKPVVIVGGSSVLYGTGQPGGKTIADFLRSDLGDNYTVLNLAMRGGDVAGMALFIAEALQGAGYKVFYMADVSYGSLNPTGNNPYYNYIYWQYRFETFSQAWRLRDGYGHKSILTDVAAGQRLNSLLRFDNLWTQLGYQFAFTVYSKFTNQQFWQARRELHDPEREVPTGYFYAHADMPAQINVLKRMANDKQSEQNWAAAQASWLETIPEKMRDRALMVLCKKDPRINALLSIEDQTALAALYDEGARRYSDAGLHAAQPCKDFDPDDYVDTTHLSVRGAEKLAAELAKYIKQNHQARP